MQPVKSFFPGPPLDSSEVRQYRLKQESRKVGRESFGCLGFRITALPGLLLIGLRKAIDFIRGKEGAKVHFESLRSSKAIMTNPGELRETLKKFAVGLGGENLQPKVY